MIRKHDRKPALAMLTIILTLLPLLAHAGWTEQSARSLGHLQAVQASSTESGFPISFVPNGRQRSPDVACNSEDRCLTVWEDNRNGSWNIYGQWLISGELAGENFPISTASSEQHDPAVAYNSSKDEYLVVWWDDRDRILTGYNIYGRLMASDGEMGDSECPIITTAGDQQVPDVTYNSTIGEYLVVWQDNRHGDWDIYGRRIADDCTPDGEFAISRIPDRQWYPAVAHDSVHNQYLTVWWDNRNSPTTGDDIYGQILSHDGSPLSGNFPISTAAGFQSRADVTWNSADNEYLAVWADNRNSASTGFDIYAQRVSSQGELLDNAGNPGADSAVNFAVSEATGDQDHPVLVYNSDNIQYLIAWQDHRYGNSDVFAQLVSGQGELLDQDGNPGADPAANLPISVAPNSQECPALSYVQDTYRLVWQDSRHFDFVEEDIYEQQVAIHGEPLGNVIPLVTAPTSQTSPAVAYDGLDKYLVVWQDARNLSDTAYDIYGQIVASAGTLPGINFPISATGGDQWFPAVASDAKDEFLVVWQDSRYGSWDVYGQHVSNQGTLLGNAFGISTAPSDQCFPTLAYNGAEDKYLIVWQDHRSGNWDIYGQCISPEGDQENSFPIVTHPDNQERPDVVYNSASSEYLVVWQDYRHGDWDIYARRISGACSPLGGEFSVAQQPERQWYPALAYNSTEDQYLAVWWDNRHGNGGDIYGQRLSSDGQLLGDNSPISTAQNVQRFPDATYSSLDNEYLVVWTDYRNLASTAFDIYGQRVASNGEKQGDSFPISVAAQDQSHPAVAHNNLEDQCLVVWQDGRHYNTLHWEVYGELLGDVVIFKEAPIKAPPGSDIIYTISYRNKNSRDAENVVITDTLPSATTYISDTAPFSRTVVENTVAWEVGTLAGGASGQFTLMAKVSPTAVTGSILTNTIQISSNLPESDYSNNSAQTATKIPPWTFMVYLNGDNDLDPFMEEAFNKLEKAARNPNVNILALWDRCSLLSKDELECLDRREGIENTRLYSVEYEDSDLITSPVQEVEWNPGELDMGDPDTLVHFVTWARSNYPADYYFLSILDHGGGWSPTFPEVVNWETGKSVNWEPVYQSTSLPVYQSTDFIPLRRSYHIFGGTGLSWDFSDDYDYLSTAEMRQALCSITMEGAEKLDVVFYDACLAGMIEEAYEIKDYVNYFVGSENEAWGSMPYDQYINSISSTTQPRELATTVVHEYTASLPLTGHPSTISAVDLAAITDVSLAVDHLARMMMNGLNSAETALQIRDAYLAAQKLDYDSDFRLEPETDGYVDLYHLALKIQEKVADTATVAAARSVTEALASGERPFIIEEQHRSGHPWVITEPLEYWDLENAYGISIYLPLGQDLQMILENEEGAIETVKIRDWYVDTNLSFAADTQWDEFIATYYATTPIPVPTSTLEGPREGIRPIRWRIYLPMTLKGSSR
jgi:uncharacterized repeat protein (TIGR01451 family)